MHETLRWVYEPIHVKLFFLYLLAVICISTVLLMKLTYRLFSLPGRERISFQNLRDGAVNTDLLAESALANRVLDEPVAGESGGTDITRHTDSQKATLRAAGAAARKFSYLWEMCYVRVQSIKRLVSLTLLVSFLILVYGFVPAWGNEFENANVTGMHALFNAIPELLARLALGLFSCAALYGAASFFEGVLARRKAYWTYVSDKLKDEMSGE